jgi:NTE family protein
MQADGVFSGGGIKGLAFAGAIKAAEEAGYDDWQSLGGTSAGAITAMALAVGYDAAGLKELFSFDFSKIDDKGGPFGLGVIENFFDHGIVRGKALAQWIDSVLAGAPRKVNDRAPQVFGDLPDGKLKVVGGDIVHERMVVFPDDAGLYLDDKGAPYTPETFPIGLAVRISAGYPGFFPPIKLMDARTKTPGALVDGGVVASFPVFLFDASAPRWPTWAFRLFGGQPPEQPPNSPIRGLFWPVDMIKDVIDTAINALDNFELKTFPERVISIPTGSISTLDFSLSEADKEFLYDSGYKTAKAFFAKPNSTGKNRFGATPPAA